MPRAARLPTNDDRGLLSRSCVALTIGFVAVVVCYFWIDRPVAFFVHDRGINQFRVFKWLTYPPPIVQTWSPLILVALLARRAWGSWPRWQLVLFAACLSLIVADQFRYSLGDACGRYWPETWINDNPSLIGNGTYGFHPFVHVDDEGSFPSGHAARICGFAGVLWIATPRSRWLLVLASVPMLLSLVAMNYHFVGDVVGGGVLGGVVAAWAARLARADGLS